MPANHLVVGGGGGGDESVLRREDLPVSVLGGGGGGVTCPQGRVPPSYMLHYRTETAQFLSPQTSFALLLLGNDLSPDVPAERQLASLGRLYLPEDGEDLLPGQVRQGLLILLQGRGQQRDWLENDKRSAVG